MHDFLKLHIDNSEIEDIFEGIMKELLDQVELRRGAVLPNRMAMAPMLTLSGLPGGYVSDDTLDYYAARSKAAGLLITEFCYVSENGGPCSMPGFPEQLGIWSDAHIEGLSKIASALKKDGAKAVVQIHHGGRLAVGRHLKGQDVVAPSAVSRHYPVRALTEDDIGQIIKDFGQAVRRAAEAGFDGVEIHGANHYLLQQFFSRNTNLRTDKWGGSLVKRMAFPLAVVREVLRAADEYAPKGFIVGYRMCPEEIHEGGVGYTWREGLELAKEVSRLGLDYVHLSLWDGYSSGPCDDPGSYGKIFSEGIDPKCKLIVVGGVFSEAQAVDAVQHHGDIIAIARGTLVEPRFAFKVASGRGSEIAGRVTRAAFPSLHWTPGLREAFTAPGSAGLPPVPGAESILDLHEGIFDKG